ncbi:MAG: tyrosine-type recombinase/integrase [Verrucomicrobiota bacterium]
MASAFIPKWSKFYYLRVKRNGEWVQEKTAVRKDSIDAKRRIKVIVHTASAQAAASATTVSAGWAWVPRFLNAQFGGSPKTLIRYAEAWTALEMYLEENKIYGPTEVTHDTCLHYPTWRIDPPNKNLKRAKWNTALTELKVFSRILSHAVHQGMVFANPCFRLGLKRRDTTQKPEISEKEQALIEKKLISERKWMMECWTVGMCQGVRLGETNCPLSRIDLRLNTISVIGKGKKVHTGPLHPDVRKLALEAKAAGRDTLISELPKKASLRWGKFFRKIGLPHLTFHSTRVTVVTRLARSGASKAQTMSYVGHASEAVNDVYLRLSAPDVAHLGRLLHVGKQKGGKKDSRGASRAPSRAKQHSPASQSPRVSSCGRKTVKPPTRERVRAA